MTLFPPGPRQLFAGAGFLALAAALAAQEPKTDPKKEAPKKAAALTLSLTPDGKAVFPNPSIRPNGQLKFYVLVANTSALPEQTFEVELSGPGGLAAKKAVTVTRGTPVAVAFEPPPPPKKEPAKKDDPAAKKDEPPPPKAAEPPPGFPLPLTDLGAGNLAFQFQVKVFNTPRVAGAAPEAEKTVTVDIKEPNSYLDPPAVSLTAGATARQRKGVAAVVTASPPAKTDPLAVAEFIPPIDVGLVFPPQVGVKTLELRAGTYRRNIFRPGPTGQARLSAADLPLTGAAEYVKFHLDVDGFARAFTYTLKADRPVVKDDNKNVIDPDRRDDPAVRLFPVSGSKRVRDLSARIVSGVLVQAPEYPTLPTKDLRFRIEVDNAPQDATLELLIDRTGDAEPKYLNPDERVALGLPRDKYGPAQPRDKRVYVIPGGPDGGWVVANTVADHVVGVDVNDLRGRHRLQAVLRWMKTLEGGLKEAAEKTATYTLIVDDTPPPGDEIDFGSFPVRHVKGVPLEVTVSADDPESDVEKVTVYLAAPGPDGKIPPDAPKFEAVRQKFPTLWVANVQLPAPAPVDPKAPPAPKAPVVVDVTAVAENAVGLTTAKVIRIELVDPKGGTIAATVKRGPQPQPNVEVSLRDNEGKEKGVLKTDAKGVATFVNLPPGAYRLYAGKPDASTGQIGNTVATVPDPPDAKNPIKVDLDLVKRR